MKQIPRAKAMSPLTNCPLPPIPAPDDQHRNGKRERSPIKGLFESPSPESSPNQGTVRPTPSRGRERARIVSSENTNNFPRTRREVPDTTLLETPVPKRRLMVRPSPNDNSMLLQETPRPLISRRATDADATVRYARPPSSLGFVDKEDDPDEDYDRPAFDTIRPSSRAALGVGLGIL